MLKKILEEIVETKKRAGVPNYVIKIFLKEYLQYPVLNYLYNSRQYKDLVFTGGSCLRICFNGPRLSEDLDFDLLPEKYDELDLHKLAKELKNIFETKYLFPLETKCQGKMRIYLKFPVLRELELASIQESDLLYVKLEFSPASSKRLKTELTPISRYNYNFMAKNYPLPALMAKKINAFLARTWFKGKENEIDIKGRDFYDLFWYLQKGIQPDFASLDKKIKTKDFAQLKKILLDRIEKKATARKLSYDLKNFFPDQNFIDDFCKNYKAIIKPYLIAKKE